MSKKTKHSNSTYARWKRELSPIYKFSFRNTKNFTPQQKAAISRIYNGISPIVENQQVVRHGKPGLKRVIQHIKAGRGVFKPAKKSQVKSLKNRFLTTNKGVVVYGENIKKVRITGKGKNTSLEIRRARLSESYVPKYPGEKITETINRVFAEFQPAQIKLAVNQYRGLIDYNPFQFERYAQELQSLEEGILSNWGLDVDESPFNGVYAIYYHD